MKLDKRIKALIAVGASIAANCQPCLASTKKMALACGADPQELDEAIQIGKRVRQGAASKMDSFSAGPKQADDSAPTPPGGCGCSTDSN